MDDCCCECTGLEAAEVSQLEPLEPEVEGLGDMS